MQQRAPHYPAPADHTGTSLHTLQPEITIVEVRGAVDAYNAERLSNRVDDSVTRYVPWDVPDKQLHRWEGEGGALYAPEPRRRLTRLNGSHAKDADAAMTRAATAGNVSTPDRLLGINEDSAEGALRWSCRGPTIVT